jgi:hypothetical protein
MHVHTCSILPLFIVMCIPRACTKRAKLFYFGNIFYLLPTMFKCTVESLVCQTVSEHTIYV